MIRVLAMIAVAGFLLSAVCISVAVAIGGPEVVANGSWAWNGPWSWVDHHHHWSSRSDGGSPSARDGRTLEAGWTADALELDLPAHVRFTQAPGPAKLVVTGPRDVIDNLKVHDGRIGLDGMHSFDAGDVTVELTAPKVTRFTVNGEGEIEIAGYDQPDLQVTISGDGRVRAAGKAQTARLTISGSGEGDFGALAMDRAEVNISGSGAAKVGPKTSARLDISGSGDVTLLSHPRHLETHVSGNGTIDQDEDAAPAAEDQPQTPAKPAKPAKPAGKSV